MRSLLLDTAAPVGNTASCAWPIGTRWSWAPCMISDGVLACLMYVIAEALR